MSKYKKKVLRKLNHIEALLMRLEVADAEVISPVLYVGGEAPPTDDEEGGVL